MLIQKKTQPITSRKRMMWEALGRKYRQVKYRQSEIFLHSFKFFSSLSTVISSGAKNFLTSGKSKNTNCAAD